MKKMLILAVSVLLLFALLPMAVQAADPEVQINSTIVFEKNEMISHKDGGSYPVLTSTYTYRVITAVTPQDANSTVTETPSGFIVTFVKSGTAKIKVTGYTRETYSKYNTEEQQVLDHYDKKSDTASSTMSYTVISLADNYKTPDGYVAVFKDGYEYIDFASQEVIDAKFGKNSMLKSATLQNFYGFSYSFADNTFTVELNNFTGQSLFFRCPKKDTAVVIRLKGTNTLTGSTMGFDKEVLCSSIVATGSKSSLILFAEEKGAVLNIKMDVAAGKNDSSSIKRYTPFFFRSGTQINELSAGCRLTLNADLNVDAQVVASRAVNLSYGDFLVINGDVNYSYSTTGFLDNYTGVEGRLMLNGTAIFDGKLVNTMQTSAKPENLFPKITYMNDFTGGAYFECSGGYYMDPKKVGSNEIFIPNTLYKYNATADGAQYHSVVFPNDTLLKKVDAESVAAAFPEVLLNKFPPSGMTGAGFVAGFAWRDGNNKPVTVIEKGGDYTARACFAPTKGYYVYWRNLSAADGEKAKTPNVQSVSTVPLPNTTTTYYDTLDFQLYRVQAGSPTFNQQPKSQYANVGETVEFYAPYSNVNYDATTKTYKSEWHIITKTTILGITFNKDRVLTADNATYSGTKTNTLKVKANDTTFKATYYCKIYGAGYNAVSSDKVKIIKYKTVSSLSMSVSLGTGRQPTVGYTPDHAFPTVTDEKGVHVSSSEMISLDSANSFWYVGAAKQSPARMADTEKFQIGKTYTFRFTINTKSGYQFDKDLQCVFQTVPDKAPAQILFNDNSNRTVCTVDFTFGPVTDVIGNNASELHFNKVSRPFEGVAFQATAVPHNYAHYDLVEQTGWHPYAASSTEVMPTIGKTYYCSTN